MTRVTVGTRRPSVQTENRGAAAVSEATQPEVNTGTATGVYVSPKTLAEKVEVITASGTDTYTATIPGTLTSGRKVYVKFTNANTGASTLNGTAIKKSVSTALASGDIAAGEIKLLAYDGTNFQVVGGSGGGGGGHTIQQNGANLTQRTNLNIKGTLVAKDDSANDATTLDSPGGNLFLYYNFY